MGQKEEASNSLDRCLKLKPDYAKALVKRGDIHMEEGNYEDAINDYSQADTIASGEFGVNQKLKTANAKKKANKKDYY